MPRTRTDDREPAGRKKRTPLGAPTQRLASHEREGFHPRWVNDTPGRLARAEAAGYEFVTSGDEQQEKRRELVGRNADGSAMYAYLMEIPREYYEEDQAAKMAPLEDFDRTLNSGTTPTGAEVSPQDAGQFYRPRSGGSSIQTK